MTPIGYMNRIAMSELPRTRSELVLANPAPGYCEPVYSEEQLQAAVAAERERCARICEEVEDQAWALWNTMADPHEQGRSLGAAHCAQAIRAAE